MVIFGHITSFSAPILFCTEKDITLTKTFATPKSFTKGLVLLSVYIIAYFPNSHNIDFATFIKFGPGRNNITLSDETELASVTVPSSGNYVILAVGGISGGNSDFVTWGLYKNSTKIGELFTDQVTRPHASLITQSYLNQDDTVSFRCTADGAQTLTRPNGVCIIKLS